MVDLKQFQTKTKTSNIVFKRKLEEKKKKWKFVKSINQKVDSFSSEVREK